MEVKHQSDLLKIVEHDDPGYAGRTRYNAENSHLTLIFGVNLKSSGTALTIRLAGARVCCIDMLKDSPEQARKRVDQALDEFKYEVINIAGNGMTSFAKASPPWTQEQVNAYLFAALQGLAGRKLTGIRSGGQTGADLAGIVAAKALGVKSVATFPKGLRQRDADGKDHERTAEEICSDIDRYVELLSS